MKKIGCLSLVAGLMGALCGCGPDYQKILMESAVRFLQEDSGKYSPKNCTVGSLQFINFTKTRVRRNQRAYTLNRCDTLVEGTFRFSPASDGRKYYVKKGLNIDLNEKHEIHSLLQQLRTSHFESVYKKFAGKLTFKQILQWLYEFSHMEAFKFYEIDPVVSPDFEMKNVIEVLDGEVQMIYLIPNGDLKHVWDIEHLNNTDVDYRTFLICESDGKLSKESENYLKEMDALAYDLSHRIGKLIAIGKAHKGEMFISLSEAERLEMKSFVKYADALFAGPVPRMKVPMRD